MTIRRGVTLLEVLITIAIVAILMGLMLVAVQKVRVLAVKAKSDNNLRQLVLEAV